MKIAQRKNPAPSPGKKSLVGDSATARMSPAETFAAPAWRLPGGIRLAEYALRGGFVASSLLARAARER